MNDRQIVIYCGLLLTLSAFSIDIMLPAFSAIGRDLEASYNQVQLTIPVFIVAIGVGQFFVGSISDRFGRRVTILWGLGIFIIGALLAAMAPSIEVLLFARVLQGLGNSVAPVVSRAILRDRFEGSELARNIAFATGVFAVGPIIAPLVGAVFMLVFPWPVLFVLMMAFGTYLFAVCLFRLPETLREKNAEATNPARFMRNIRTIMGNSLSRFYLILSGIIMSLMLLILTASPQIYEVNFGVTGTLFAVFFAAHGLGIIVGQIANRHMITKFGIYLSAVFGNLVLIVACVLMVAGALSGWLNVYLFAGLFILFATSYLIVYANASALTLQPHGQIAGFASSFFWLRKPGDRQCNRGRHPICGGWQSALVCFHFAVHLCPYAGLPAGTSGDRSSLLKSEFRPVWAWNILQVADKRGKQSLTPKPSPFFERESAVLPPVRSGDMGLNMLILEESSKCLLFLRNIKKTPI